jgi:uncharacterized protein
MSYRCEAGCVSESIEVRDNPADGTFEIWVDGVRAGFTVYSDGDGVRTMPHTVVDEAYAGQGLSKRLDATRAAGLQVRPLCPAVAAFIEKNAEYADLVS